ncbi:ganglioside-induced differentiation-associated protein 1-like isoform X3 [Rhodnius prolixus]|uniref:ganglioside-induced differentiation-associated protein 1-like isoform X3 n=1 Tax=Rhodnius prolixus TaxID=13249 RepID=UPI003D187EF9
MVLMALIEKGLKYRTHLVNIANGEQYQDWFLKINPRGEVPVIQDGENIVPDSLRIINYLEDKYTGESHARLIPTDESADIIEKHNHFHTIIHELPADVITIGSFYHTEFVRSPKLPFIYPVRRHMKTVTAKSLAKLKTLLEKGHEAGETLKLKIEFLEKLEATIKDKEAFSKVLETVDRVLDEVEQQLWDNQGKAEMWLICPRYTLADIGLTTLLERLNVLGLEDRYWGRTKRPCLAGYWERARQRQSYKQGTPSVLFHMKTLLQGITYLSL